MVRCKSFLLDWRYVVSSSARSILDHSPQAAITASSSYGTSCTYPPLIQPLLHHLRSAAVCQLHRPLASIPKLAIFPSHSHPAQAILKSSMISPLLSCA